MRIAYRPADLADRPDNTERRFILDSWARSFRDSHAAGFISMRSWFRVMLPELGAVVVRPGVEVVVAYDRDDEGGVADLFGYIVAEPKTTPPLVYYVFVKEAYRRQGFARALLAEVGLRPMSRFDYACKTAVVSELERKVPLAKWTPIAARYERERRKR